MLSPNVPGSQNRASSLVEAAVGFPELHIYLKHSHISCPLQVHLIEGIIDEVDSMVHVSWVQPRVLGIPQVKALRERLDSWVGKVHTTLLSIEAETPDLVAA